LLVWWITFAVIAVVVTIERVSDVVCCLRADATGGVRSSRPIPAGSIVAPVTVSSD